MAEPAVRKQTAEEEANPPVKSGESVTSLVTESRRYREEKEGRPPAMRVRSLRAYWITWRVIWSYLWLKFRARFHSETWVEHNLRQMNLRNARRIERAIVDLQGLFIKV